LPTRAVAGGGGEGFYIGFGNGRGVKGRVHSDEDHLQFVGVRTHQVLYAVQFHHGGGADVRAAGEAEDEIGHFAVEVGRAAAYACAVGHRPLLAERFAGDVLAVEIHLGFCGAGDQQQGGGAYRDGGQVQFAGQCGEAGVGGVGAGHGYGR